MSIQDLFYWTLRFLIFIIFKTFFFFKVTGRENIPKKGGCIIASNHLSYLDPLVVSIACPHISYYMARHDLFHSWFGKLISFLYAFPVERGKGDLRAIRKAIDILRQEKILAIFPEGTRSPDGELKQGEPGVGLLAAKTGVPVIPTYISGTDKSMPVNGKDVFLFTPVNVCFGKPIRFREMKMNEANRDSYLFFSNEVIRSIQQLSKK